MSVELCRTMLKRCALFRGLGEEQVDRLARRAHLRDLTKGEALFQQGDESDCLYILIEGTAAISILSEAGREMIVQIANPGDAFGEISLIDGLPRSASCTMRAAGRAVTLHRTEFQSILEDPAASGAIMTALCTMLRATNERAEFLALHPLQARMAHVLLTNARSPRGDGPDEVRLTQNEMALMAGAARPRVNQILKRFEDEGIIEKDGRVILVPDHEPLKKVAKEENE